MAQPFASVTATPEEVRASRSGDDVIPDYGGPDATFEVVEIAPPRHLVYRSTRGHTDLSWAITLTDRPTHGPEVDGVALADVGLLYPVTLAISRTPARTPARTRTRAPPGHPGCPSTPPHGHANHA